VEQEDRREAREIKRVAAKGGTRVEGTAEEGWRCIVADGRQRDGGRGGGGGGEAGGERSGGDGQGQRIIDRHG